MILTLSRTVFTERSTSGTIAIDGAPVCVTLEDRIRAPGIKIRKETAIAPGRYRVVVTWSERFRRDLPLLLDVPQFQGIRIHPGNTREDTEGCILVGLERDTDRVLQSRDAFARLFPRIQHAAIGQAVWIEIVNVNPPQDLLRVPPHGWQT